VYFVTKRKLSVSLCVFVPTSTVDSERLYKTVGLCETLRTLQDY
jgi:hypothetical protein